MGFLSSRIKQLENNREVLEMPNSVNFLMITKDKKIILSSQKRAGNSEKETLNCFGGYIEKDDECKGTYYTVYKEMYEESNITRSDVEYIHEVYTNKKVSVGYTTEASNLYILELNKNLCDLDLKCNDINENITIKVIDGKYENVTKMMEETNCLKFYFALSELGTILASKDLRSFIKK